jgi:hypothetical protein
MIRKIVFQAALAAAVAYGEPVITFSQPSWTRDCVSSKGPPSISVTPDKQVFNVLLTDFTANVQPQAASNDRKSVTRTCRIRFDAQIPSGYRAIFKAAQYAYGASTTGATSQAQFRLRHGMKRFFWSDWTKELTIISPPDSTLYDQQLFAPSGKKLRTNCGSNAHLIVELTVAASARDEGDVAMFVIDSIGLDSKLADQLALESCSK